MTFKEWSLRHPAAANELISLLDCATSAPSNGLGETAVQQRVRIEISRQGARSWRNNVGAVPSKCEKCGHRRRPVRYGLANDSAELNKKIKSSDLILAIPRQIRPHHVGMTIAQFGCVEVKKEGWSYTGSGREPAQAAWLSLIDQMGGFARFSTGRIDLSQWES